MLTCAILSLALIGGLALLCFTKAFGIVFLGESRHVAVAGLNENRIKMTLPMMSLSFLCVAIGIVPVLVLPLMKGPLQMLCHVPGVDLCEFSRINSFCKYLTVAALSFSAILGLVLLGRRLLAQGKIARTEVTWDCGFFKSSPRLQYTASSFAYPIVEFFSGILRTKKHGPPIHGFFPARTSLNTHTYDIAVRHFYAPFYRLIKTISSGVVNGLNEQDNLSKTIYRRVKTIFKLLRASPPWIKTRIFLLLKVTRRWLSAVKVIQHGDIRIYLLYIVAALCVLLILT